MSAPDTLQVREALKTARLGRPVFPTNYPKDGACSCGDPGCISPAKHPKTEHGHNDATTDEATILKWWAKWPPAGIGMRTGAVSNVVVVDVDDYKGGGETLADHERAHGALPPGPVSLTGGGGHHHFFKHPGFDVRSKNIGTGQDVKGDGGYVVLPYTWHISGRPYRWDIATESLPLPDLPQWVIEAANGSKDKVSYTHERRGGVDGDVGRFFQELEDLLGPGRQQGKWTKYRCPFHPDSTPSLGVTPDGWVQCFGCDERGWADTVIRRLKGNGNFVSGTDDAGFQDRVIEALEAAHLYRPAQEMKKCGRLYKVYQPDCGDRPAYPVDCKAAFCPRSRGRRLAAHFADKRELFEALSQPVAIRAVMPAIPVADPDHARDALKAQTDRLLDAIRTLGKAVPELKDTLRGVSPVCRSGALTVTHGLIVDGLGEHDRASVTMALRQIGADVHTDEVVNPAQWLYQLTVRFDFETSADIRSLVTLFKGTSIVRGWGAMRPATGGMGKGAGSKAVAMCPCGKAPLGKALTEVPVDQVVFIQGFGFTWRGPPRAVAA
jgi:Bifunctional DNA primase/polymerase, N-terminal/CHC2 zinc finger